MRKMHLRNCRVVDGTGRGAMDDFAVVVDRSNGQIDYVGPMESAPKAGPDDEVFSLEGYTVLPGLFNVHTHLNLTLPYRPYKADPYSVGYWTMLSYRRAVEGLRCGVTTMRCTGGLYGSDIAVRDAINKMMLWGPRILSGGSALLAHGGHGYNTPGSIECSGVAQFREAAREEIKSGADLIKICLSGGLATPGEGFTDKQMTEDEITAVVEVAHMAGKKVASHTGGDKPIQDAVRLGVDCIEHGYVISQETAKIMAEAGTWLVPTLAVTHAFSYLEAHGSPAYHIEKAREAARYHKESISRAIAAGVKIGVGTDLLPSDPIDGTNATVREMELLVEAGMTPLQAMNAGTLNSATLCEVADVTGSVEVGKQGDLVAVRGKPDANISDLRNLSLVARSGHLVWSNINGVQKEPFHVLPEGLGAEGGTFRTW